MIPKIKRGEDSQGPYYKAGASKVHYQSGDKKSRASAKGRVEKDAKKAKAARKRKAVVSGGVLPANIVHLRLRKN